MNKSTFVLVSALVALSQASLAKAESYVGASLGWTFSQKMTGLKGNENLDYSLPIGTTDGNYYPGTTYSDVRLKDILVGGLKAGYYFDSYPNLGLELEVNYSQPNMKRQNVTLTNTSGQAGSASQGVGIGDLVSLATPGPSLNPNSVTEDQLPAKVKLLRFSLNALYRYQGFSQFTPYIGAGPSLNIIRITGTGESGHFIDPVDPTGVLVTLNAPNVSTTAVNVGLNFKLGAEYKLDQDWGLAGEYHYNWTPVDISHFRSVSDLTADLESHALSIVLTRHF